jgi:hypothetical protein
MRKLSLILFFLVLASLSFSQDNPHGEGLTIACADCHNTKGWTLEQGSYIFSHDITDFPLKGQHEKLDCLSCHESLVFSEARNECMSCHTDIHQQTVGFACERCHDSQSWIVNNIVDVHRMSRFPLLGAHLTADCNSCHPSASLLKFEPVGVDCYDCHMTDYEATTSPNHVESGFSTSCTDCHLMNAFSWQGTDFTHDFFPLTEGHAMISCAECHPGNDFGNASPECISCHQDDYNQATNPSHTALAFSTNCTECHTTSPGWEPAEYKAHDTQFFPIYTGSHQGEWGSCIECHPNPSNYGVFTCIDCHDHNKTDMDDEHEDVGGYIYESQACLDCHPTGDGDMGFNHNASDFPLTGAHLTTLCADCHADGYAGTPTYCAECHTEDFNQSINPNHVSLGLADDCASCHTTQPEWKPATFDIHDDYYTLTGGHIDVASDCISCHNGDYVNTPNACNDCHSSDYAEALNPNHTALNLSIVCEDCHTTNPEWTPAGFPVHNEYYQLVGAHAAIASDCAACHEGNYENTPNTCYGCHQQAYDQTTDPPHASAQFSTDCELCHSQSAWEPSTFDHDGQYFPIYSGSHQGEWGSCVECHPNPGNYALFTCIDCHEHNKADMDDEHEDVQDYVYSSVACFECHPNGEEDKMRFNPARIKNISD